MPIRSLVSIAVALLLMTAPAAAWADGGAGDQQYQDPLAAPAKPKAKAPVKKAPVAGAPAAATAPASSAAPAATAAAPAASSSSRELPRTGSQAGLVALFGLALVASGAVLRRRTASR